MLTLARCSSLCAAMLLLKQPCHAIAYTRVSFVPHSTRMSLCRPTGRGQGLHNNMAPCAHRDSAGRRRDAAMTHTPARISPFTAMLVAVASIMVIIAGLRFGSNFLGEVVFAFFLAVAFYPLLSWLMRKGVPAWLGVTLIILGVTGIASLLSTYIYYSIRSLQNNYAVYQAGFNRIVGEANAWLDTQHLQLSDVLPAGGLDFNRALGYLTDVLGWITAGVSDLFIILLLFIFFMIDAPGISHRIRQMGSASEALVSRFGKFGKNVIEYFRVRAVNGIIVAAAITLMLVAARIDLAIVWGILAFFLGFIPTIGLVLAVAPAVVLALLKYGWGVALAITVGAIIINIIGDDVITPRLASKTLNLSPSIIFLSFLFWAWVFGPIGALISVPLTMVVLLVLESYEQTRWLVNAVASEEPTHGKKSKGDEVHRAA